MEQHTPGPWSGHPYSTPEWMDVGAGETHGPFKHASLSIGSGRKLVAKVEARTPSGPEFGYPEVETLEEMRANASLIAAAPDMFAALQEIADGCMNLRPGHVDYHKNRTKAQIEAIALAAIAKATTAPASPEQLLGISGYAEDGSPF